MHILHRRFAQLCIKGCASIRKKQVGFNNSSSIMLKHRVHTCLLLFLLAVSYVECRRVIRAAEHAEKSGCYIVKLRNDTTHEVFERTLESAQSRSDDFKIYARSEGVYKFFTVKLSDTALDEVLFSCMHG